MTETDTFDVDDIIEQLLKVRGSKPGKEVNLPENTIKELISRVQKILMSQPMLLRLEAPIKICGILNRTICFWSILLIFRLGDIHGQYFDLLRLFEYGGFPPESKYLFLGYVSTRFWNDWPRDYVDRGKQSIETICLLFAYKVKYPDNFFILRGNHETDSINRLYGFYDECKRRYSVKLWKIFSDCFNCLPVSALISDRILCMHGGLSPSLQSVDDISSIERPCVVPEEGLLCDILWSDPDRNLDQGWAMNDRGVSFTFSETVVEQFLENLELDLICRAHQVVEDGYDFFADRGLVTIFSAPNYCGEFDNCGAIMSVDETLLCSFQVWSFPRSLCFRFWDLLTNNKSILMQQRVLLPRPRSRRTCKECINFNVCYLNEKRCFLFLIIKSSMLNHNHFC